MAVDEYLPIDGNSNTILYASATKQFELRTHAGGGNEEGVRPIHLRVHTDTHTLNPTHPRLVCYDELYNFQAFRLGNGMATNGDNEVIILVDDTIPTSNDDGYNGELRSNGDNLYFKTEGTWKHISGELLFEED